MDNKISINGNTFSFTPGETILEVAVRNGIDVPTLCHLKGTMPTETCRVCVVEVAGREELATACSTAAENDMDVKETAAYDLPSGKHPHRITTEPNHALGAVMTIIDICNACLIQLRQNAKDLDQHQRQDEVKRMSSFLYAVFKAVEDSPCPYEQKVRTVGKFNQMAVHCFLYR